MNLNDAQLFSVVADQGSFSKAARALGLPKSTVSNRISRLEAELGVRLIERTSRHFKVTELGREFHRHVAAMLIEAQAAESVVQQRLAAPAGTVRVSSSPGTLAAGLQECLAGFLVAYPDVVVSLHATNRTVDLIEEEFDLAVRAHEGELPDSSLIQRRVCFSPRWLVAAPAYLARTSPIERPDDLASHAGLCFPSMSGDSGWTIFARDNSVRQVYPRVRLAIDDPWSLERAAANGLGVAILPSGLCRKGISEGNLARVLPAFSAGGVNVSIVTTHRRGLLPSIKALSDYLLRELPERMCSTAT